MTLMATDLSLTAGETLLNSFRNLELYEATAQSVAVSEQQAEIYLRAAHERMTEARHLGKPMPEWHAHFGEAQDLHDVTRETAEAARQVSHEALNTKSRLVNRYKGALVVAHSLDPDGDEPVFFAHEYGVSDEIESATTSGILKTSHQTGFMGHMLLLENRTERSWRRDVVSQHWVRLLDWSRNPMVRLEVYES